MDKITEHDMHTDAREDETIELGVASVATQGTNPLLHNDDIVGGYSGARGLSDD